MTNPKNSSVVPVSEAARDLLNDREDKRTLSGKHEPKPGICRVCKGKVVAEIRFDTGGRIGGQPVQGHVSGWHCESCKLVYRACPPEETL